MSRVHVGTSEKIVPFVSVQKASCHSKAQWLFATNRGNTRDTLQTADLPALKTPNGNF